MSDAIYKSIAEHPGFTAQGAYDAFVKQYTQNQLDAAIAAERERCAKLCDAMASFWGREGADITQAMYAAAAKFSATECAAAIRNQEKTRGEAESAKALCETTRDEASYQEKKE